MRGLLKFSMIAASLLLAMPALATEPDQGLYPNGAEGSYVGLLPPSGFYLMNYLNYYTADKFKASSPALTTGFKANLVADFVRLLWVTPWHPLGAKWAMYAVPSLAWLDVDSNGRSQSKVGIGDFVMDPIALSWDLGQVHMGGAFDIVAPTGSYTKGDIANIGNNIWQFEPLLAFTWLSDPDHGFETSFRAAYDFYTRNDDFVAGPYQNGQTFHIDYSAVKHFDGGWDVGLGGYWWQQTTADSGPGAVFGDFEGRALAIGPEAAFHVAGVRMTAKWQHEFDVANRPEGDKFWLRAFVSF